MSNKHRAWMYPMIILLCMSHFFFVLGSEPVGAFSEQIVQRGATGDDVVELQSRLQYNGFYDGTIDGVYGWSTYWSVRKYQEEFGLDVDGLVGPQMKDMLERSTDFNKEFVHQALREGRKFTHYGGVPLENQKGEKGSRTGVAKRDAAPEEGAPAPEEGVPAPEEGVPAPEEGAPAPEEGAPAPEEGVPAPEEGVPAPQEGVPAPEEGAPAPEEGAPAPEEGVPAPEEGVPAPQEGVPAPEEGAPVPDEAQPTPEVPTPTPEEAAPAPEEPAPTPEEPVPAEEAPVAPGDDEPTIEQAINVPSGMSDNDIQLMAQCVHAESRGEPYVGMVAVAAVILNRVNSSDFPNTISEVIFEPRAFEPVANGTIYNNPSDEARRAVLDAVNGQDPTGHALYFFNPSTARSPWIWSRPQIKTIGKHVFAK
ncbi:cell wall hydrolase [Bacillus sp. FJAT-45350]|uniref:cell wall hydrolase n=1 Tax=Bacillus sp. FJAT-45350 TaxID=2011014 RepID=UPI00211BA263|nr:cell wall hydrolase [Bacillus sp. FJAT-45350]